MNENQSAEKIEELTQLIHNLNKEYVEHGLQLKCLENVLVKSNICHKRAISTWIIIPILIILASHIYKYHVLYNVVTYILGIRCIVPNNYFIWEASRPISNCNFCINVSEPIILQNLTRNEFALYAYSPKPIVIKKAFLHWNAMEAFDFNFFKDLYESIEDSYKSVDEECQFLHFKSDFTSIRDVFMMSRKRIENEPGQKSWYVGWGNCHPQILAEMRKFYPKPHFLPEDCEIPPKEYVFMGYDTGATMHLDFINRLMWQAQLRGNKNWYLVPSPECENVCSKVTFTVEPGDAVLLDTRVWYHGTSVGKNEFSLSIQSEYG